MATYKVVDADQLEADMGRVADTIRAKGGTTEELAWPDGYSAAIEAIEAKSQLETVQITVKLLADPTWHLAYSYINDNGEIENIVYRGSFGIWLDDAFAPFELSGDYVIGVLDIPKGTIIAIGNGENVPTTFRDAVNCSVFGMGHVNAESAAIYDISDGASITAILE